MANNEKIIYNTEMYRISENDYSFVFDTKRKAYDKGSRDALIRFNKKYYKGNNFNPSVSYPKTGYTADIADKKFNEELLKGILIKTLKYSGKFEPLGVLSISKGKLHLAFEKRDTPKQEEPASPEKVEGRPTKSPIESDFARQVLGCNAKPPVVVDPTSDYAKTLVGKTVEISKTYNFVDSRIVVLTDIFTDSPMPFVGKTLEENKQISGVFIKEHRVIRLPLDLDDKAVRDSLRGKWIFNKVTGQECLVSSFRKDDGHYKCNGLDARTLMNAWELEDGGFLGVEK